MFALLALLLQPPALDPPAATLVITGPEGEVLMEEGVSAALDVGLEGRTSDLSWALRVELVDVGAGEVELRAVATSDRDRWPVIASVSGPAGAPLELVLEAPLRRKQRRAAGVDTLRWTVLRTPELRIEPAPFDPLPPDAWPERSYTLVWDDARLRVNPRDASTAEQVRALPEGRTDPGAQASPYRVVAHWDAALVELETTPGDRAPHCHAGAPPSREHPFQLFAPRGDLLPLTAEVVREDFSDGTGFTLAAGLALTPDEVGRYRPALPGVALTLALPEGAVDRRYRPSGHLPIDPAPQWWLHPNADGVLGWLDGQPVYGEAQPVAGRRGVDEVEVTLRWPCAELRLLTDEVQLRPGPP